MNSDVNQESRQYVSLLQDKYFLSKGCLVKKFKNLWKKDRQVCVDENNDDNFNKKEKNEIIDKLLMIWIWGTLGRQT